MRTIGTLAILLALVATAWQGTANAQRQPGSADTTKGSSPVAIAHGVATMPSDSVAWRLVEDDAPPVDQADFHQYALGFALATDSDIQIQDGATGQRDLLNPDGGAFVADGASELRASTSDSDAAYVRFGLVYADARRDAQGGKLISNTDAFDAPSQPDNTDAYQLILDGGILNQDQKTSFDSGGMPALLYVTGGSLTVGEDNKTLNAGDALSITGTVNLTGTQDDTRYAIAFIGEAVQSLPTPAPTVSPSRSASPPPSRSASPSPSATASASPEPTGNAIIRTYLCRTSRTGLPISAIASRPRTPTGQPRLQPMTSQPCWTCPTRRLIATRPSGRCPRATSHTRSTSHHRTATGMSSRSTTPATA